MLIIWTSISLTRLRIQEYKKFPNKYSVYMVRLDTPTDALIANIIIFRLILKIMLIEFELNFKIKSENYYKVIDI